MRKVCTGVVGSSCSEWLMSIKKELAQLRTYWVSLASKVNPTARTAQNSFTSRWKRRLVTLSRVGNGCRRRLPTFLSAAGRTRSPVSGALQGVAGRARLAARHSGIQDDLGQGPHSVDNEPRVGGQRGAGNLRGTKGRTSGARLPRVTTRTHGGAPTPKSADWKVAAAVFLKRRT